MDQLLLDIQTPKVKSFENFIIGDNSEAISIIKKFITDKNLQFFYLWGVEGAGKSHLSDVVPGVNTLRRKRRVNLTFYGPTSGPSYFVRMLCVQ